jgi:hypothetical protein
MVGTKPHVTGFILLLMVEAESLDPRFGRVLVGGRKAADRTSLHPVYLNTVAVDPSLFLAD